MVLSVRGLQKTREKSTVMCLMFRKLAAFYSSWFYHVLPPNYPGVSADIPLK